MKASTAVNKTILYIILSLFVVIFVYPFVWMILTALKADTEILDNPLKMPALKYYEAGYNYDAVPLDLAIEVKAGNIIKKKGIFYRLTEGDVEEVDGWHVLKETDRAVLKKGGRYYEPIGNSFLSIKGENGNILLVPIDKKREYAAKEFTFKGKFQKGMRAEGPKGSMILLDRIKNYTQVIPFTKIKYPVTGVEKFVDPDHVSNQGGVYHYQGTQVEVLKISRDEFIQAKFIRKQGRRARIETKKGVRLKDFVRRRFIWENFSKAWKQGQYFNYYLFNSVFTSLISTILQVAFAAMAAFAFARFQFKGIDFIFTLFLSTMMIPSQMLLIPNYIIVSKMGLYNTYWGIILPWLANVTNIFLLRQFFKSIPNDLFDSVRIDGGSVWAGFIHIALPLSKPILVTTALFSFIFQWNSFIWILIITNDPKMQTLQVGLSNFSQAFGTDWNLLMAASTIVILPLVVMYFFVQRRIIESLARSGLKG